ncbi:CATRA system-associated protein [Streptomyces sp. PTD5-9]|uniref:CATRA system-associated protein n=1 Tax=Streptomyces sp. PTD5-9 TaxID=3120150 RepID=UPI0030086FEC
MTDWSEALGEADPLLAAVGAVTEAGPRVWAGVELALGELDDALRGGDAGALRRALYALEDSLPSERMRMLGGSGDPVPPPPELADRVEDLVDRIRVAGADPADAPAPGARAGSTDPTDGRAT